MPYAPFLAYWQLVLHQLQPEIKTVKCSTQRLKCVHILRRFTCLQTDDHLNSYHLIYKYKYASNNKVSMQQSQKEHETIHKLLSTANIKHYFNEH